MKKYSINKFNNIEKKFIRLYTKLYTKCNQHLRTLQELGRKILLVDNTTLNLKYKYQLVV